jgi:hypothetical protein
MQGFLAKHGIPHVNQDLYSPEMLPCDFWLFPRLKTPLKGSRFDSHQDFVQKVTVQLHTTPKQASRKCF